LAKTVQFILYFSESDHKTNKAEDTKKVDPQFTLLSSGVDYIYLPINYKFNV